MTVIRADVPMTPDQQQAQQQARQELAQGKYHLAPTTPPAPTSSSPSPSPTPTPTPTAAAAHHSSGDLTTILVIVLIVLFGIALLLLLRKFGKPRRDAKDKKADKGGGVKGAGPKHLGASAERPLTGAALHRHNAEQAARGGDWQEAIRERFRAIIAMLDERALLPERRDRTADEAAQDAGLLLPEHAAALLEAARAFDEVEYGEYLGTPEGYGVISGVDEAVGLGERTVRR